MPFAAKEKHYNGLVAFIFIDSMATGEDWLKLELSSGLLPIERRLSGRLVLH